MLIKKRVISHVAREHPLSFLQNMMAIYKNTIQRILRNNIIMTGFTVVALLFVCVTSASADVGTYGKMTVKNILAEINRERVSLRLGTLVINPQLQSAAESKVQDMVSRGYFSHNDPYGNAPWMWIERAGYHYEYAGENLAIGFNDPKKQHHAWMESQFHRRNILNSHYTETGIAVARGKIRGVDEVVVVQFFGAPVLGSLARSAPFSLPQVRGVSDRQGDRVSDVNQLTGVDYGKRMASFTTFARTAYKTIYDAIMRIGSETQLWHNVAVIVLVIQFFISVSVALRIYARVYQRTRSIDLGDTMM